MLRGLRLAGPGRPGRRTAADPDQRALAQLQALRPRLGGLVRAGRRRLDGGPAGDPPVRRGALRPAGGHRRPGTGAGQFDPGFGKRRQRPAATLQSGYQCRRRRLQRAMRARTGTSSAGEGILRMAEAGGTTVGARLPAGAGRLGGAAGQGQRGCRYPSCAARRSSRRTKRRPAPCGAGRLHARALYPPAGSISAGLPERRNPGAPRGTPAPHRRSA